MSLEVFQGSEGYKGPRPVVTIGNFDGVHLGHQFLIARTLKEAKELGAPTCAYTFEPPPQFVLNPDRHPPRILSLDDKLMLLAECGVDSVVVENFDMAFSAHPALWFATEVLGARLNPMAMVVGHDFRFGLGRSGTSKELKEMLPSLLVHQVDPLEVEGMIASSSRIRELIAAGAVCEAAVLLGRPYFIRGDVEHGDGRGKGLGFATANLELSSNLTPGRGVYAVEAEQDGCRYPAVANLGFRPTFGGRTFSTEIHLLDFEGDLYGKQMTVHFMGRIRDEMRFDSVDQLKIRITQDVIAARGILEQ